MIDGHRPTSWFDDDTLLEQELRTTLSASAALPSIPGYDELRELARGGQGVVYSGRQISTRRIVAVKVLRDGPADGVRGLDRFHREVDLAASLKHPSVVAIHDSGTTADGRPYLVMELVDGPAIDHCEAVIAAREHGFARPWLDALVETFASVCDGVAHAHQRGVVHRDIKPGNIRVDGEGRPRVLDFGLAKDLSPDSSQIKLSMSGTGVAFLGSLPWASPEQALGRLDDVDVRSDVYALGVVLYQLLCVEFPYDIESDLRTALDSIVQAPPIALRRRVPSIPSDIETIVLKCLQKDRDRRYQSAGELARDLRRFLAGEPIDARRDSTWYLLRTTARRHRVAVVLGTLTLLSLIAGLIVSLVFWRDARNESIEAHRQEEIAKAATLDAERQKDFAVAAAKRTGNALSFLADAMVSVDPNLDGPDVKMIDVVRRAVGQLPQRFADDPDSKSFCYTKFIEVLRNLGDLTTAERLGQDAVDLAVATWGDDHANTIFTKANHALILHKMGRSKEAIPILEAEAERVRKHPELMAGSTRHVFSNLGLALLAVDRVDDAEKVFREMQSLPVPDSNKSESECLGLEMLAAIQGYRGNYKEAIELLRKSLPLRIAALGTEHSLTLRCQSNLAFYLAEAEQVEEAEKLMRENVAVSRRRMGPTNVEFLTSLNNHASYLERLGRLDEAEAELRECYEGRVAQLGEEHAHTLITLGNLASVATKRGNLEAAERDQRKVAEIRARISGPEHRDTLIARNNLAHIIDDAGRHTESAAMMKEVIAGAEKTLGVDHVSTAQFRSNYGTFLFRSGDTKEAEVQLRHALRVIEEKLGRDSGSARGTCTRLCELLRATGRAAEADELQPQKGGSGH